MNEPVKAFIEHMLAHTVCLVKNAARPLKGLGIASGVLVHRDPNPLLLTAGHIFRKPGPWTLETTFVSGASTLHVALRDIQLLASIDLDTGKASPIDIAWATVRLEDIQAGMRSRNAPERVRIELQCYKGPLDRAPNSESAYGYAAWNRATPDPQTGVVRREASYEVGLTFDRRLADGMLVFKLARHHQGNDYYRGASGAPVADEEGAIVGVLLSGVKSLNELVVAPLSRFSPLFDLGAA